MGRASEKFDEQLFTIKLFELPPLLQIDDLFFPTISPQIVTLCCVTG